MSSGSSSGSNDPNALAVIRNLKGVLEGDSEDFGRTLGTDVRLFIRNTRTTKDELRAIIRCFLRCTSILNRALAIVGFEERVVGPPLFNSLNKDQLRSDARKMNQFFKSQTLETFLTICNPYYEDLVGATRYIEAEAVVWAQTRAIEDCDRAVHKVLHEGFDCKTTSEDEE